MILLQDTHLTEDKLSSFNSLWTGRAYHSCYKNNSRGCSILINKSLHHEVIEEFTDNRGCYKLLQCRIGIETYLIGSIYGPNKDEPQFYTGIGDILDSVDCDHVLLGGDFNFIMDAENDCFGYVRENNVNAKRTFTSICNKYNLKDLWRQHNPHLQQYTWHSPNFNKGARLDMFFASSHLLSSCCDVQIIPSYRTDHSIISMCLKLNEPQRGPGLWKFNESLLNDENYVDIVHHCINATIEEYAVPVYTKEFLSSDCNYKEIQFKIDDGLFYETLLMKIRGETVRYSKRKTKHRKAKEKELILQIAEAHTAYSETRTEENAIRVKLYQAQLEEFRKPIIDGLIVRSRTQWHEEGEKSTKYFLGVTANKRFIG